jgi:hypothetical protein
MCLTAEQAQAKRGGQFTDDFDRLYLELVRAEKGQPAQDPVARRSVEMMLPEQLEPVRRYGDDMRRRRRLVVRDVRAHGQRAVDWYGATSPDLLPERIPQYLHRPRGTVRCGGGRPKGQSTRSSARSGDSGEDDQASEPEPHPEPAKPKRRLCAFCGKDMPADRSPRAKYCKGAHADRDRQRRKRQRDRERARLPRVATTADFWRMLELNSEVSAKLREVSVCRCNGSHLEFEPGQCFRCGHWLPREIVGGSRLVEAFFTRLAREEQERREKRRVGVV